MSTCPYIHNSMVCITGDMFHVSSDVYIDSVKSDQSDVVSEEIEVDSDDTDILSRVHMDGGIAVEELIGSIDGQTEKSLPSSDSLQLGHQNVTTETVKMSDTSVKRVTNVIKKILFLRPNEDPEVAKAKTIKDLMASFEKEATCELSNGLALPKETIIEIVSIKAPNRQKPKLSFTKGLTKSKVSLCGNKFFRELDTPSVSLLRSNCRTPSPVRRGGCCLSEIKALDHQNCYFDSSSLKLTSADSVQPNSLENHRARQKDEVCHMGSNDVVQEARKNFDGDDGNDMISNSCAGEIETDLEVLGDKPDTKRRTEMCDGKFNPVHSVRNQLFNNCLHDVTKDQQKRERDRRPPFSYSQLIQMALSTKADKRMALREIYQWIENNFSYYRYSKNPGWKNSIRHSLSLCDAFVRKKISHSTGRTGSSYWTLDLDRLLAKNASCTTNFSEMSALPNRKYETDLMSCAAKAVIRKRRSSVEIKQQTKQTKLSEQPSAIGVGCFTAGFDVMADSSVIDDMLSVSSFNCSFQTVSGLLMEHETPDILADSTTEEVLGVTCASDFLCHRDRGTFVARQPDPTKPKVCRPHRRKQELKVLRTPSETDGYDQSKFDEEVTASSRSFDEIACGEALVGEEVFWMETPESDELVFSLKDEDDITSMLFSPPRTSECLARDLSWTSPVQDLAPVPLTASVPVMPFGFETEQTVTDFGGTHNGKIPLQSTSDGAFCNVHNIARWLSDCYGGCLPTESQMFCNLPGSEEVTNLDCDPDSDFFDNLFSFPPCL